MFLREMSDGDFNNLPKAKLEYFINSKKATPETSLFTDAKLERAANEIRVQKYTQNKLAMG